MAQVSRGTHPGKERERWLSGASVKILYYLYTCLPYVNPQSLGKIALSEEVIRWVMWSLVASEWAFAESESVFVARCVFMAVRGKWDYLEIWNVRSSGNFCCWEWDQDHIPRMMLISGLLCFELVQTSEHPLETLSIFWQFCWIIKKVPLS